MRANSMNFLRSKNVLVTLAAVGVLSAALVGGAQAPAPQGGGGAQAGGGAGGRGGRGIPNASPAQTQAVADMNTALAAETAAVATARTELATVTFAQTRNVTAINLALDKLRAAELALAAKRADQFAALQAGPNKLNAEQVAALVAASGGAPAAGAGGARGAAVPGAGRGN